MSRKKVTKRVLTQNIHRQCPNVGYSSSTIDMIQYGSKSSTNKQPTIKTMVAAVAAATPYIAPQIVRALLIEMCDRVSVAKIDNVFLSSKAALPIFDYASSSPKDLYIPSVTPYVAPPQIVRGLLIEMCDRVSVAKIDNVLFSKAAAKPTVVDDDDGDYVTLSDDDDDDYAAAAAASSNLPTLPNDPKDYTVCEIGDILLSERTMRKLRGSRSWLNDELIYAYMLCLKLPKNIKIKVASPHEMAELCNENVNVNYSSFLKNFGKKRAKENWDYLAGGLNIAGSHWVLIIISFIDGRLYYVDSFDSETNACNRTVAEVNRKGATFALFDDRLSTIPTRCTTQEDASSCGVFTCRNYENMLNALFAQVEFKFVESDFFDIYEYRVVIEKRLIADSNFTRCCVCSNKLATRPGITSLKCAHNFHNVCFNSSIKDGSYAKSYPSVALEIEDSIYKNKSRDCPVCVLNIPNFIIAKMSKDEKKTYTASHKFTP